MAEPRVCIYQPYLPPDPSGAGKQALTLARALLQRNVEVILLGDRSSASGMEDTIDGVPVRWVRELPPGRGYPTLLRYWGRIGAALLQLRRRFDVLQLHGAPFELLGAIPTARLLGKGIVVRTSLAGELANLRTSPTRRFKRGVLRLAHQYVALSTAILEEAVDCTMPASRITRIPNGVDRKVYRPVDAATRVRLRRELDLPINSRLMIYHGVFMERKSLHWLIQMMEPILDELDLTLVLVGGATRDESETGYARALRRQVSDSPARDRIQLRGFSADVQWFLQAADLYILPSTGEGLPNALLEAMACGLVPLASRTSGTEDVIWDGTSGFLFEPRDASSFRNALSRCLADGETRLREVSKAAVARIDEEYSIEATAERYLEVYRRAAKNSR